MYAHALCVHACVCVYLCVHADRHMHVHANRVCVCPCVQFTKSPEVSIATLLQYVPSSLEARVVFFPMLPRNTEMVQAGVFDAPVGDATISFVNVSVLLLPCHVLTLVYVLCANRTTSRA